MADLKFSQNYRDLCRGGSHAVDSGFQFEFYCERCSDTWRTDFVPYRSGQGAGWLGKVSSMFGGVLGEVGRAAEGLAEAGWGSARDGAFKAAVEQAKGHFNRCGKCHNYVCDTCWDAAKGLCLDCAPDLKAERAASYASGQTDAVREASYNEGQRGPKPKMPVKELQLVCPQCTAQTRGAKFCPECGYQLATPAQCPECRAELSPGAKFCGDCGQKLGA